MNHQASLLFYKLRYLFFGVFIFACLLLFCALVTAIGSNTVIDAKTHPYTGAVDSNLSDSPNLVTAGMATLVNDTQNVALTAGSNLYRNCQTITALSEKGSSSALHGVAAMGSGAWHGTTYVTRGIGSGILFTLRLPGKLARPITSGHAVSSLIRPADNEKVPVIDAETSAAVLAQFNAQQQQEIAKLEAGQVAANRSLDGQVVAGDPNHGGYPAKWDYAPQDSSVDQWGMYNRECVSYVAWKVFQTFGDMPYWGGVGNANQWVNDARRAGIPTGSAPRVHAVAVSTSGYYGHAMWVEAVNGNMIYVSQYNYDLSGHYSEMWVNGSGFTYIYFK